MIIPKGKYLVGDPCYSVIPWEEFCRQLWENQRLENEIDGINTVVIDNIPIYTANTQYGDGRYDLTLAGRTITGLPVDAGLLGLIPIDLAEKSTSFKFDYKICAVIEFRKNVDFCVDPRGNFFFGDYEIKTGDDIKEEETCPECGETPDWCRCGEDEI